MLPPQHMSLACWNREASLWIAPFNLKLARGSEPALDGVFALRD